MSRMPGPRYFAGPLLAAPLLTGCAGLFRHVPTADELAAVRYEPVERADWEVSTPAAEGLDPKLVATLYYHAGELPDIYSLLVAKHGRLIAEKYFHGGTMDRQYLVQSVSKSFTSALVGIALDRGCLRSIDQKAVEFFPELVPSISDARKKQITIRQLLQMRAGFPWEESSSEYFEILYGGFRPSHFATVPLNRDPGSGFEYSNLSSHVLALIVARACQQELRAFAQENLLGPLGIPRGDWWPDLEGNALGHAGMHFTPRDLARFGQLYLDGGRRDGHQLVPAGWVRDSLAVYSTDAWDFRVGSNFQDIGYGYQWWSVRAGVHRYHLAWGHGGQQIALVHDQRMVIVLTTDPLHGEHGGGPWDRERANLNLVADFIATLPQG